MINHWRGIKKLEKIAEQCINPLLYLYNTDIQKGESQNQ